MLKSSIFCATVLVYCYMRLLYQCLQTEKKRKIIKLYQCLLIWLKNNCTPKLLRLQTLYTFFDVFCFKSLLLMLHDKVSAICVTSTLQFFTKTLIMSGLEPFWRIKIINICSNYNDVQPLIFTNIRKIRCTKKPKFITKIERRTTNITTLDCATILVC